MGDQRTKVRNANHGPKTTGQDIMEESSTQKHRLGDRLVLGDRVFRYSKNGAVALNAGYHVQSAITMYSWVPNKNYGAESIKVSVSGAAVTTADLYAEGYAVITVGSGVGSTYKIKNNTISTGAVSEVTLYEPIAAELGANTTGVSVTNKYRGVLVGATATYASDPVGIPLIAVTANYYFWAQTWGPVGALVGALDLGADDLGEMILSNDTATAGALYPLRVLSAGSGIQTSNTIYRTIATAYLVRSNSATAAFVYPVNLCIEP